MLDNELNNIFCGDCLEILKELPPETIDLIITSPPYFQQREYGNAGIGNEKTVEEYIENLLKVFRQCVRITKKTGSIVFNLGDKYIDGNLLLVPYRFAIEVQREKQVKLINELTWVKINPTPKQDPKKLVSSKEPFFIFAKSNEYYFNKDAFLEYKDKYLKGNKKAAGNDIGKKYFELIEKSNLSIEEKARARKELSEVIMEAKKGKIESFRMKIRDMHALPYGGQAGGRLTQIENKGFTIIKIYGNSIRKDIIESTVETIKGNVHPAVYPEFVVQELIKLLTKENDIVLDPFLGSGTTAVVAKRLKRNYIGIEIHPEYIEYAKQRLVEIPSYTLELFI
ncbi:MAG: site-specific DNA-methyltransferase [Bacteroidetes bacterium]|nr:site-specific DNA-methyltransferase [Bacteroidota bacterium]MBU2636282.1 site-specific DNA-methyltransferase [Bacteroidota bacterium]